MADTPHDGRWWSSPTSRTGLRRLISVATFGFGVSRSRRTRRPRWSRSRCDEAIADRRPSQALRAPPPHPIYLFGMVMWFRSRSADATPVGPS